ncbi:MAG: hypothetical protein IJH64_00725 [Oscillospiraceae bacterium]|nr:hypothetical protein [Oscillospiraceae bacterium]
MTQEERKTAIRANVADAAHAVLDHLDNIEEAVIMTHGTDGNIACIAGSGIGTTGLAMIAIFKALDAAPTDQIRAQLGLSIVQNIMSHIQKGAANE